MKYLIEKRTDEDFLHMAKLRLNGVMIDFQEQPEHPEIARLQAAVKEIEDRIAAKEV